MKHISAMLLPALIALAFCFPSPSPGAGGSSIDPDILDQAVQASLNAAAGYLLSEIETTNGWTFAITPPEVPHGRKATGLATNYYTRKTIEVPVWEKKTIYYEVYEVMKRIPSGSPGEPPKVVKIKKQRRIKTPAEARDPRYVKERTVHDRTKQVGTKKVTRLVRDPKGTIKKVHKRHKREYADFWPEGFLGQNAMVLLTLLKCGIPEDDERLGEFIRSLESAVIGYPPPDTTWDLAWLAAAFSNLQSPEYDRTRRRLLSKLIDGQILRGRGRGLWGPVSINNEMLAKVMEYNREIMSKAEGVGEKMEQELQNALEHIADVARNTAQQGLRYSDLNQHYLLGLNDYMAEASDVFVEGLPYYFYVESFADLQSTATALYALNEAAVHDKLPAETIRPEESRRSRRSWPPAEKTDAVLARCASAITTLPSTGGSWTEANIQQECHDYRKLDLGLVPDFKAIDLPNPAGAAGTARACAALLRLCRAVGIKKMSYRYGKDIAAARQALRAMEEKHIAGELDLKPPPFCHFLPGEMFFQWSESFLGPDGFEERDRSHWQKAAVALLQTQQEDGYWGESNRWLTVKTTSNWRQMEIRERERITELEEKMSKKRGKEIDLLPETSEEFFDEWLKLATRITRRKRQIHTKWRWPGRSEPLLVTNDVASTCYSILCLLEGYPPPPVAYIAENSKSQMPDFAGAVLAALDKRDNVKPRVRRIEKTNLEPVHGSPVIFVSTPEELGGTDILKALSAPLSRKGAIVMCGRAASNTRGVEAARALAGAGKAAVLPEATPWLDDFQGKLPELEACLRPDGSLGVLLLPWSAGRTSGRGLKPGDALQTAYLLTRHWIEKVKNSSDYFIEPDSMPGAMAILDDALDRLLEREVAEPLPPVKEPAKPGEEEGRREDEVWR
ncbi:MAG: hypothetical protein R6V03_04490 [Kiritimatiellia bacterium]